MIDEGISFGAWLRARRDKLGMTQDELADKLALSFSMLRKLEAGSRRPSGQIASLLADYFGIPGDEREAFIIFARTGYGAGAAFTTNLAGSEAAPWRATRSRQTNLPATLTTLIGREKDKADLLALVTEPRSRVRLLTLTGAPGIGKTRLALEVASALVEHFDDGVYLVGLAPISDPDLVLPTIAQTLSVQITGGEPVERALQRHLESKHILLVLDNFEQVLDATPALIGLLEGCPWLKVLVTSREALHVRGERRVPLMPLPVPQSRDDYDPASMAENPSVALFVERAQSVRPDFSLTPENSRDVALVCARLEGLPLALEIAAARVALFTPQYILSTLERRLHALEGGPRDLPERQRALRNTIAWSYSLLSVGEQRVFNKLAAFVGGCTLEGAEAVCGEAGVQPLDALLSLARKSLLSVNEGSGEARFVMLEMIGEYAYERLVETGESAQAQQRHAVYYLDLVERAEPELRGRRQLAWLGKLDAEHGNIRTALAWSLKTHSVEIGLRLIGALRWFWTQRSHYMEGLRWGRSVLAMPGAQERNPARARALWSAGALA
jgi:predicted ATPase/DNA-binding XRE family transcriptional regulator